MWCRRGSPVPSGSIAGEHCLAFWRALALDSNGSFEPEDVVVAGDRAVIRWRFRFGPADDQPVRGVNLMHVRDGLIVETLGDVKSGDGNVAEALEAATR